MQCVYKCALRFSKGIEPRRAHVSFGATPKSTNALLLEKVTKNKIVFGARTGARFLCGQIRSILPDWKYCAH